MFLVIAFIAPRGLGMGDVKLTALIGLVMGAFGLRYVGVAAGAAILLGGVGGILALIGGKGRKSAIPFGPFLTAGAFDRRLLGRAHRRVVPALDDVTAPNVTTSHVTPGT